MTLWTDRPAHFWDPATPAYFDGEQGAWQVFAYDDVVRVLNDRATFSSAWLDAEGRVGANPTLVGMWAADGRRHQDLRSLVAEAFRAGAVAALARTIAGVVDGLLDKVADGPGFEVVTALARPLPDQVICRVLGIDAGYAERMHGWRDELHRRGEVVPQPEMAAALGVAVPREPGLLADLRQAQVAGAEVDGEPLSDDDIVGALAMLLWAGAETTAASIADALLFLTEYGHWPALGADPELVPGAVEEVLRWYPAFPGCSRLVLADTELGGQALRAGDSVTAWLTAAHRDPARFPDPDTFAIRRHPNRHLAFGGGRHLCLGAALARLELQVVVERAARRLPGLRRDPDRPVQRRMGLEDSVDAAHFVRLRG